MRIALVVPHIFMQDRILPDVIFAPGTLAVSLADGLIDLDVDASLFSPGKVTTKAQNVTADLSSFDAELMARGYGFQELLKKHPLTFISLARAVQAELIADVIRRANAGEFDVVHFYTNEEELALVMAQFCQVPAVFTHHDAFNFSAKYRAIYPKYKHLNWISISDSQRQKMPEDTNWLATIHHGIDVDRFQLNEHPQDYFACYGRIVKPKGVHLAIAAAKQAGVKLRIAGKHYSSTNKKDYWTNLIQPQIDGQQIEYVGFLSTDEQRQEFLGNAKALLIPATWEEPFGMVMIEAMACGTPTIALRTGAMPEVIEDGQTGFLVDPSENEPTMVDGLVKAMGHIDKLDRSHCRERLEDRFGVQIMVNMYQMIYEKLL